MNGFELVHECVGDYTDAGQHGIHPNEPIVRCKDCAFFGEYDDFGESDDMSFNPRCWRDPDHTGHGWPADENGFCSWGMPKEGASNGEQ